MKKQLIIITALTCASGISAMLLSFDRPVAQDPIGAPPAMAHCPVPDSDPVPIKGCVFKTVYEL